VVHLNLSQRLQVVDRHRPEKVQWLKTLKPSNLAGKPELMEVAQNEQTMTKESPAMTVVMVTTLQRARLLIARNSNLGIRRITITIIRICPFPLEESTSMHH